MTPSSRFFNSKSFEDVIANLHVVAVYIALVAYYFHLVAEHFYIARHIDIVAVSLMCTIWITFTELTIAKNRFVSSGGTSWQFGQVRSVTAPIVPTHYEY
jgi:hypothetical protein